MWKMLKNQVAGRFSIREARVLCYVLGPISAALLLHLRHYGEIWSIRFHAFHSILMAAFWGATWGTLRISEAISPSWFLATLIRELRFVLNLGFIMLWIALLLAAYRGERCGLISFVQQLSARLAGRKTALREDC